MPTAVVRMSESSRRLLHELSARDGKSMQAILEQALEDYRRRRFLEEVNLAYAELRKDQKAWKEIRKERSEWDGTLTDGLECQQMGHGFRIDSLER